MSPSETQKRVLCAIQERPGISAEWFSTHFGLSPYRLNRVFRCIERDLGVFSVVRDPEKGVWLVKLDGSKCSGMNWVGVDKGGFRQCCESVLFPDGRCYDHSQYECEEMVALSRRIHYLAGPRDPSVQSLAELPEHSLDELLGILRLIEPVTRLDCENKSRFHRLLMAAAAFRQWKKQLHVRDEEDQILYDFRRRHADSSGNPFEFSLRKYFLLLQIPVDAAKEEVLKAWKRLAMLYHPDVRGKEEGDEEMMKAVNEAKDRIFNVKGWD